MEYRVAFEFVIGLSNEEPLNRRTTTQPTLVAAKVWASLYPSSKRNVGVFREELSIQLNKLTHCVRWDAYTRGGFAIMPHMSAPVIGKLNVRCLSLTD